MQVSDEFSPGTGSSSPPHLQYFGFKSRKGNQIFARKITFLCSLNQKNWSNFELNSNTLSFNFNGEVNSVGWLDASTLTSLNIDIDIDCLFLSYDQSGSQGNLCDSWQDDRTPDGASGGEDRRGKLSTSKIRALPAEYPFQANLGLPQSTINFDLTHKRGKFLVFSLK